MPARNARHWSADQNAAVVAAYTQPKRGLIKRLSIDWDTPVSAINYHATAHLDLSPTRRIRRKDTWIVAEDQLLREHGHCPIRLIRDVLAQAGYQRSMESIASRRAVLRRRESIDWSASRDTLTVAEIADGLGCSEKTVIRWIQTKLLKAHAQLPEIRSKCYVIKPADLKHFCLTHTHRLLNFRVDVIWYTDIVARQGRMSC